MLGWIARLGLVRLLGRRAVPLLMVVEAVQLVRGLRRRQGSAVETDDDARRTEPRR
jgi:hypothetical protein